MKALVVATCVAVLAAVGHYFWTQASLAGTKTLAASPMKIEQCERAFADIVMRPDSSPLPETGARFYAVRFAECEEFGLFSSVQIGSIMKSQIGPYLAAYKSNPEIWLAK